MEHYFTNNQNLKSQLRIIDYKINDFDFKFTSDNGVFSKDKIDYGSITIIKTIIKNVNKDNLNILDVGCGYGFMGIVLSKILNSHVDMVDVNNRAINLANQNITNNKVDAYAFSSFALDSITKNYDLIVTNPPIRAGNKVVNKILLDSMNHLNDSGSLWFVIRKDQGAKTAMKLLKTNYQVELVEKDKGFYVMRAEKH